MIGSQMESRVFTIALFKSVVHSHIHYLTPPVKIKIIHCLLNAFTIIQYKVYRENRQLTSIVTA